MVKYCAICRRVRVGFTVHRFPRTDVYRVQWEAFIERHGIDPTVLHGGSYLCSAHFVEGDFVMTPIRRRLKPTAVPTVYVRPVQEELHGLDVPMEVDRNGNFFNGMDVVEIEEVPGIGLPADPGNMNQNDEVIVVAVEPSEDGSDIDDVVVLGPDDLEPVMDNEQIAVEQEEGDMPPRVPPALPIIAEDVEYVVVDDIQVDVGQLVVEGGALEPEVDLFANVFNVRQRRIAEIGGLSPDQFHIGQMDIRCPSCNARHFIGERVRGHFSLCCGNGKVLLAGERALKPVPVMLRSWLSGDSADDRHFQKEFRQYNNSFAFASLVSNEVQLPPGRGPRVFVLHGQVYNLISDVNPGPDATPRFCQLYFLDTDQAMEGRMQNEVTRQLCRPHLLNDIEGLLRTHNEYAAIFWTMREVCEAERVAAAAENPPREPRTVSIHFVNDGADRRRYNLPVGNEVAVVFVGNDGAPPESVDFVVYYRNLGPNDRANFRRMQSTNRHVDPMLYPLFFPYGEQGWATHMPHEGPRRTVRYTNVTMKEYSSYRLAVRYNGQNEPDEAFSAIHSGRFLLQQYVCDLYVRVESNNLRFIRLNQSRLRADTYQGLMDHIALHDIVPEEIDNVGRRIILPSTFHGGPRFMQQNYQDAMAVVRKYGKPDLFITFTCNPRWPEIVDNLPRNVVPSDRPDLISRVFNHKLKELIRDVHTEKVFGSVDAFIYVVEFQKRGLPHAHILVILHNEHKLRNADDVDRFIRADIPDPVTEGRLHNIVVTNMIHGPCGKQNPTNSCMTDGQCSKHFPKAFTEETVYRCAGGYPAYRRPNNGLTVLVRGRELGNECVVPYNPYLLLKYNAHINVEACSTVKSVMYLYKYVYKGHDAATLRMRTNDEVDNFLDTRYVCAPEAVWRLFSFHMHERSHVICRLAVHLEGMQNVYFEEGQLQEQVARAAGRHTTLTGYFRLNAVDQEARQYLYHDIPNRYCWNARTTTWTRRRNNTGDRVIGRMYSVSPLDRQRFHLRLLLLYRRGCESFEDLRTVNHVVHPTYEEAAIALRLLENDNAWRDCLGEASVQDTPKQLRALFATICVHCSPANPLELYNTYEVQLMADFARDRTEEVARSACLNAINQLLSRHGKALQDFGLPAPAVLVAPEQDEYDAVIQAERGDELLRQLNVEQRVVYETIMEAVTDMRPSAKTFFVDGPGGTGKTMLYSCLMSVLRGQGRTVLAVAFTGIAATLLEGGRTVHSTFGLPFGTLTEVSTSVIKLQSQRATKIRDAALIVWDEAPMSPGLQLTVVDRLLRDIMQLDVPFGGKPILFGGDFRQILPVVPHGTRSHIVNACIKANALWPQMRKFALTRNMRADGDREFAAWLLLLGNGHIGSDTALIRVPDRFVCRGSLVDFVFPNNLSLETLNSYRSNIILCPLNEDCRIINNTILRNRVEGLAEQYLSVDSVVCDDPEDAANYPIEFLNSLEPSGLPPHNLALKVGAIVMLVRNLDANRGLCNGTRMVVTQLRRFHFKARLLNIIDQGEDVVIPRIPLTTSEEDGLPFTLRRVQFPVRLAFSITINKSQGQTFDRVGIYLPTPVFTHGQLYVAFSRARNAASVRVELSANADGHYYTENVVFKEIL